MEKIKKLAAALAAVGTIGITLLFLYYPIKDMVRSWSSRDISLAPPEGEAAHTDEVIIGATMTQLPPATIADIDEEIVSSRDVTLKLAVGGLTCEIDLWREEGDSFGYFFLPSVAAQSDCEISVLSWVTDGSVTIDGKRLKAGDVLRDISWDSAYPMQIYNLEEELVAEFSVIFSHMENTPALFIETESGSLDYLHENKDNEERGQAQIITAAGEMIYQGGLEQVSGRGNSTWGLHKKSYEFTLDNSTDLFGFGAGKSWNLLADGYDDTHFRNLLVFSMGEQAGLAYTPQGTIVSLYCNGEYQGNYTLCEKIKVSPERIAIRDMEEEVLAMYREEEIEKIKTLQARTSEDGRLKWVETGYIPEDISGGYVIEREVPARFESETLCGFRTAQGDCYTIASPRYATLEQVEYIAGLMQEMQDAAAALDGINPQTGRHYTDYIDMDSLVRKYLVEEITKNYDGGVTSSYFYKPADNQSTKLFAGPLWDYDVAFGNCDLDEFNSDPTGITMLHDHIAATGLFRDLYQKEDFQAAVKQCYQSVFRPILTQMLEVQIDELDATYGKSVDLCHIRWRSMHNRYRQYDNHADNVRYLKYFIEQRMTFLDEVWIQGETYHRISFYVDGLLWKRIHVKDGELPGPAPVPRHTGSLLLNFTADRLGGTDYNEYRPVYQDMDYYAKWREPAEEGSAEP